MGFARHTQLGAGRIQFLPAESASPISIADGIHLCLRPYRRDRVAVFINSDSEDSFLRESGLEAQMLDPKESWHWTGAKHRKNLKSILLADYEDWFQWFMSWQRFSAFQVLVLFKPMERIAQDDRRGYFDGLLTRLLSKPSIHRVLVIEEGRFLPTLRAWLEDEPTSELLPDLQRRFGSRQLKEAVASLLYGTHLSTREFPVAMSGSLFATLNPNWHQDIQDIQDILRRPALVERISRWILTAGYHAREMVESLETQEMRESVEDPEQPLPALFQQTKNRGPSELSRVWLEELARSLLRSQGWYTLPIFYEFVQAETQKVVQSSETFPDIFNQHYNFEYPADKHVFIPSRAELRRVTDGLVRKGKLAKVTWFRELGRPSTVYYEPGRLPFLQDSRCGQCAFYVPLRRQCRIWWLLDQSYRHYHSRWAKDGQHPLTQFEIYKMKNSWRVGPHSSACTQFFDRKKDHSLKALPEVCEICGNGLSGPANTARIVCSNCRTRYYKGKGSKVRVLTSYEHEFRKRYQELAGVDPSSDLKRLIEERRGLAPAVVEQAIFEQHRLSSIDPDSAPKTVMLFPEDRMLVREGRLYVFKRRSMESLPLEGSTLIDHGHVVKEEQRADLESAGLTVRSISRPGAEVHAIRNARYDIAPAVEKVVAKHPEFVRKMAMAMAQSAIHATQRIRDVTEIQEDVLDSSARRQMYWVRRLERESPSRFLVCEAAIMREYWNCYYLPIKGAYQRSGPRKKARFVREFITDPAGRARGYTAVDAAINYLHQRRLFKARSTNYQLGLDLNPGEGFLHRKRWNPEGLGLVLDLIDPFKFADREKLLGAITDFSLNWRDFYSATDRHGVRFYYPKPEAVGILEGVGEAADTILVHYAGVTLSLVAAYRRMTSKLIETLKSDAEIPFTEFVYH